MFKYFPQERIDVLQNNLICFNNPRQFNDPFEFHSLYDLDGFMQNLQERIKSLDIIENLNLEQRLLLESLTPEHKKLVLESTKLFLNSKFNANRNNIVSITSESLTKFNEEFIRITRVLCFTEKPNNLLMWAHYASSHTGFVIEFDPKNNFFHKGRSLKDEYGHLRKVDYLDEIPKIDPISNDIAKHYLVKSKEWEYEQEWRIFAMEKDAATKIDNTYDLYPLPPESIKRVILGCQVTHQFEESMYNTLMSNKKYSHVIITKAKKSKLKFAVEVD